MKRRAFLAALLVGLAALAALTLAGPRRVARAGRRLYLRHFGPDDAEVARGLQALLPHLQIPPATGEAFARDYRKTRLEPPLALPLRPEIGVRFLLSTDFVQNRGDASRPLEYVMLYSPYHSPCYNPYILVPRAAA